MKQYLFPLIFLSVIAQAETNPVKVYLDFEEDYMSNDVNRFEPWLPNDYTLVQTLHVPGIGSDSREVTKKQLLAVMKSMNTVNTTLRSKVENSTVSKTSKNNFCVQTHTTNSTLVSGKSYEEKEVREACFTYHKNSYKVTKHSIDVYYKEQ